MSNAIRYGWSTSAEAIRALPIPLSASDTAGAIYVGTTDLEKYPPQLTAINVTSYGNSTDVSGGAVYGKNRLLKLINCTMHRNHAKERGGSLYLEKEMEKASTGYNTIIVGTAFGESEAGPGAACFLDGFTDLSGSLANIATDGSCGKGFSVKTPEILVLGPRGEWGGATGTIPLLPGSAAIKAGNKKVCPLTDRRGVQRKRFRFASVLSPHEQEEPIRMLRDAAPRLASQ